ncbi:IS6 family transposase [Acetobacter sacchari]|uniref:IS6 family transposase n=1 Tax=Acetobacter sacchari TaxID=2661687 RepID=A0ABS3LWC9_9PROT|nr:IS6 family transposase [Acetobacter sacchari]
MNDTALDATSREAEARPGRMMTDRLKSYGAAKRQVMPCVEHRSHKGLNNRTENSRLPLRKRERVMQKFRSPGDCQHFVSDFSAVRNVFIPPKSIDNAISRHLHRLKSFAQWNGAITLSA